MQLQRIMRRVASVNRLTPNEREDFDQDVYVQCLMEFGFIPTEENHPFILLANKIAQRIRRRRCLMGRNPVVMNFEKLPSRQESDGVELEDWLQTHLTPMQHDIVKLFATGYSINEIADMLNCCRRTVTRYRYAAIETLREKVL